MSIQERNKTGSGNAHLNLSSRSITNSAVWVTQSNAKSLELTIATGSIVAAVRVCAYTCLCECMCYEKQEAVFYGKSFHGVEKAGIGTLNVLTGKPIAQEILNSPLIEERF